MHIPSRHLKPLDENAAHLAPLPHVEQPPCQIVLREQKAVGVAKLQRQLRRLPGRPAGGRVVRSQTLEEAQARQDQQNERRGRANRGSNVVDFAVPESAEADDGPGPDISESVNEILGTRESQPATPTPKRQKKREQTKSDTRAIETKREELNRRTRR